MIARLVGTLVSIADNVVVLDVHGVGYRLTVSAHTLGKIAGRGEVVLHVYTHVREDTLALYGFLDAEELSMFELLISVSGVGPKAALGILAVADPASIASAVLRHDASILTKVSGVGKKTAERVILELENKVGKVSAEKHASVTSDSEALDALLAMGYSVAEAREAVKAVPADVTAVGERVKAALKLLGKSR